VSGRAQRHDGPVSRAALAYLGGRWARDLVEVTSDLGVLDTGGRWAVVLPYSGEPVCARFSEWVDEPAAGDVGCWTGPAADDWTTATSMTDYLRIVERIREAIAAGTVYQANACRVMSAPLPDADCADVAALHRLLERGNPAPFGGFVRLPDHGIAIATASPELFVSVHSDGSGRVAASGPIKGTGHTVDDLTDKDAAENIMIVDLVRNDISRVSEPGTVTVPRLLEVQEHPGLVHLVSYVQGRLVAGTTWRDLADAAFPPGSVTGAPKSSALRLIDELERSPREFYCGAIGWVDADTGEGELAVAIRTFWVRDGEVRFGTGAGITWPSDAQAEWRETANAPSGVTLRVSKTPSATVNP